MNIEDDSIVKAFIPHDSLIWVAVDILKEEPAGVYDVVITDPDFTPSAADPKRRVVNIKQYPYLRALPLQNDQMSDVGVDDMTSLNYLHEPSILENLRRRFHSHLPYTYTGDICVAVSTYICIIYDSYSIVFELSITGESLQMVANLYR